MTRLHAQTLAMTAMLAATLGCSSCQRSHASPTTATEATAAPVPSFRLALRRDDLSPRDPWAYIEPRDRAYAVTGIVVDGSLADWGEFPYVPCGHDCLSEHQASNLTRVGWSKKGLLIAVETLVGNSAPDSDWSSDYLDLYVDVRAQGAVMDRYEAGVHHLRARAKRVNGKLQTALFDCRARNENPLGSDARGSEAAFSSNDTGWTCEVLLSWGYLRVTPPQVGDWLAFSARTVHIDKRSGGQWQIGPAIEGANNPDDTPLAFSPLLLSGAPPSNAAYAWRADEIIVANEPWLEAEVVIPAKERDAARARIRVLVPDLDIDESTAFRRSVGDAYWIATTRARLRHRRAEREIVPVSIAVQTPEGTTPIAQTAVPIRAAKRFADIDATVPDTRASPLPAAETAIVQVLKACARDSATALAYAPDNIRAPQRRFRPIFEPHLYDHRIDRFVELAKSFSDGRRLDRSFPYRGFQSSIDGEWLPIKVTYPWNYAPTRRYPVCLYLYGKGQHRNRAEFLDGDIDAIARKQYVPYAGECISVVPYQRSDAIYDLERETLRYVFDGLLPTLPADLARVGIYGGSAGVPQVLDLAVKHPDRFAWICARGGNPLVVYPEWRDNSLSYDSLHNLAPVAINLQCGDNDGANTVGTRTFYHDLKQLGIPVVYDELAGVGHQFTPLAPATSVAENARNDAPVDIAVTFKHPDYGQAYWLCALRNERTGDFAQLRGHWENDDASVETDNVDWLQITPKRDRLPRHLTIDGQAVPLSDLAMSERALVAQKKAERWSLTTAPVPFSKRRGLAGPGWRIENGPLAIVYGTAKSDTADCLRERAFRILRERIGSGDHQLGTANFMVISDTAALAAKLDERNLWLIGSAEENAFVASVANRIPLASSHARAWEGMRSDTLISYIYPRNDARNRYFYVELGNTRLGYFHNVSPPANADVIVRTLKSDGSIDTHERSFDTEWKLPDWL